MYLFFDTETNGLPKNYKAPMRDLDNWPRIAQLAYALYDEEGKLLYKYCELVKPGNWKFPTYESLLAEGKNEVQAKKGSDFFKDKGYSDEINERDGLPIEDVLDDFLVPLEKCTHIIAHNMMFDYNVVGSEMIRAGLFSKNKNIKKLCTKEIGTNFCEIPNPSDYYRNRGEPFKWPTLDELHRKLFGEGFEGAHDGGVDVAALSRCFFEMKSLGVIKL